MQALEPSESKKNRPDVNVGNRVGARVPISLPVMFRNDYGQHCVGRLQNLSPTGLCVSGHVAMGQTIHPRAGRVDQESGPIVQVRMSLPIGGEELPITAGAQLLYVKCCSEEHRCVLGFRFLGLRPVAERAIERFFSTNQHAAA